jgi:Radial spokehead-like protein
LRAQIARISHTTNIAPRGLWKIEADDDATAEAKLEARGITDEAEETLKQPNVEELSHLGNWVHYPPAILKANKIRVYIIY